MPEDRIRLLSTFDPQQALTILRERMTDAGNVLPTAAHNGVRALRDAYLWWAEATEQQLWSLTHDADVATMFQTRGHWEIRNIADGQPDVALARDARIQPLVRGELERHSGRLQAMADDLQRRMDRAKGANGHPTVLDTHVLMHYLPPDQIKWNELIGEAQVRLIVPLRVVEELDAKKYSGNDRLVRLARGVLPWLARAVGPAGEPKLLDGNDFVTVEVPVDPGVRERPADADREILDACHEIRQFRGGAPSLVTGDTGLVLRAGAEEVRVVAMPEKYQRGRTDS